MRSLLTLSALTLLGLLAAPETASACDPRSQICLGQLCNTGAADMKGVTAMDGDQKNLVACVLNEANEYRWKSMSPVTLLPNGNVGIGTTTPDAKLDVQGETRIGNSGVACSAANSGAIRYNPATKIFEGCDGAAWKTLGGESPPGTLCGFKNYNAGCANPISIPCNGHDISSGCPAGYTRIDIPSIMVDCLSNGVSWTDYTTCVKN